MDIGHEVMAIRWWSQPGVILLHVAGLSAGRQGTENEERNKNEKGHTRTRKVTNKGKEEDWGNRKEKRDKKARTNDHIRAETKGENKKIYMSHLPSSSLSLHHVTSM
jgi:hypothetical protein